MEGWEEAFYFVVGSNFGELWGLSLPEGGVDGETKQVALFEYFHNFIKDFRKKKEVTPFFVSSRNRTLGKCNLIGVD